MADIIFVTALLRKKERATRMESEATMKRTIILFGTIFFFSLTSPVYANKSVRQWAFTRLNYARDEKTHQLKRYCVNVHEQATRIKNDEVMLNFFEVNDKYFSMDQNGSAPDELKRRIKKFRENIRNYYVTSYLSFYDILFINKAGDIFYTIRKEADYLDNIFTGELAKTQLSKHLSKSPQKEVFVDFQYYAPSDEPAAFFIEPAFKDGKHLGWFVMQHAVTKVNSLFTGTEQLGMTGETFLVNKEGYLLTESSFVGKATILKIQLNNKNIDKKFLKVKGNETVTDYRGFTALTSYGVFDFLGTQWLVVAKVDEAQVVTEHFQQHSKYYLEKIKNFLSKSVVNNKGTFPKYSEKVIMVDMDEFVKADHGELLKTIGVSTCTAVIATYPGKFGYMAHISPYDKMYDGRATNLLGHIIKKIKVYDIYKFERQHVRFTVIARHFNSLNNIIDKLVSEGFLLSQINILHYPEAKCANVLFDYSNNLTYVEWIMGTDAQDKITQNVFYENNLGVIVKQFLED